MKRFVLAIALAVLPASAFAAGVDLSWKDCVGTGTEVAEQNFTCTGTQNQNYNLVLQYKLAADIPNFVGVAAYVDYQSVANANLQPFWHYEVNGCNNPSVGTKGIAMFDNIQLIAGCAGQNADAWDGDGSGGFEGIAAYGVDFRRAGNGYFILGDARAAATPLTANTAYFAFHLTFNNRTACAGCTEAGVLVFQKATLESNDGSPAVDLTTPDTVNQCVRINGGPPSLCGTVPVQATSWGQIKNMYR